METIVCKTVQWLSFNIMLFQTSVVIIHLIMMVIDSMQTHFLQCYPSTVLL